MVVKYLFFILPLSILFSCVEPSVKDPFDRERSKVIHHALKSFIIFMQTKGFYAAGIGEGLDHSTGKQNYIGLTFDIERLPNIDFARKVEVEALQEFLKYVNAEERIQDYVAEYPFPLEFIRITFISQQRREGLFSVTNCRKKLYYNQDPPENPIGPSVEIHRESYEDALRILAQKEISGLEEDR